MSLPPAIEQKNEWSCTLACITWGLNLSGGQNLTQDEIMLHVGPHFPNWTNHPGFLTTGDVLLVLKLLGISCNRFLYTPDVNELFDFLTNHSELLLSLIFTRIPTNHCLNLVDVKSTKIDVMDPQKSEMCSYQLDAFLQEHSPHFFVLCEK